MSSSHRPGQIPLFEPTTVKIKHEVFIDIGQHFDHVTINGSEYVKKDVTEIKAEAPPLKVLILIVPTDWDMPWVRDLRIKGINVCVRHPEDPLACASFQPWTPWVVIGSLGFQAGRVATMRDRFGYEWHIYDAVRALGIDTRGMTL